ncbi:MAG: ATP-binding cassette domain-containing protein [Rhodoferax sp.]|nr:ATP-binding cassette domain-containing protein [Rhodoferax sp.]
MAVDIKLDAGPPADAGLDWALQARWFCRRLSMLDGRFTTLTAQDVDALGSAFKSKTDASTSTVFEAILTPHFKKLGLNKIRWRDKPSQHALPMVGVGPGTGIVIVHGRTPDMKVWIVESTKGRQELAQLPADLRFCSVRLGLREQIDRGFLGVLLSVLNMHRGPVVFFLLATCAINVLAIFTSLYSMQVYDRVIPSRGVETLVVLTIGVVAAALFDLALKFARSLIMDKVVQEVDVDLSHRIFERLLKVRMDQFPASVGTLASQLRSYESIRAFAYSLSGYALIDTPFALFFLVLIWSIGGPIVAAVPLVFFLLSLALGFTIKKKVEEHVRMSQAAANRKLGLLVETVECAEAVKAQGWGWKFQNRWNTLTEQNVTEDRRVRHVTEATTYYTALVQQISYVSMIATGAYLAATTNSITSGGLIACSILSGRVLQPVTMLPSMLSQLANAKVGLAMIDGIFKLQTDNHETDAPLALPGLQGQLTFEKVAFMYPGQLQSVQVPQWSVHPGEKIGVIGGIGSGKSTVLKLIAGLYKPMEGRVLIDNLDIQQVSRAHLSEHIGYMQQAVQLFAGTLKENLTAGLIGIADEHIIQACQATGLSAFIATHPKGLELPISEGGGGVSGGQRQLIGITRMLLARPAMWLLDEPTANMDDDSERRIIQVLGGSIGANQTMIVVTHKFNLLSLVQRLVVMANGRIMLDGPRDAVLDHLRKSAQEAAQKQQEMQQAAAQAQAQAQRAQAQTTPA